MHFGDRIGSKGLDRKPGFNEMWEGMSRYVVGSRYLITESCGENSSNAQGQNRDGDEI